jgi:2-keto-4-pentenoate hydratase/2-oxohepta-3-ene-1,7-dioic acid hydratase in catechol pathway
MQIATYQSDGKEAVGVVVADAVANLAAAYAAAGLSNPPKDMLALIAGGAATLADVRKAAAAAETRKGDAAIWTPLSKVKLLAPIPRLAKNAFCIGRNYKLHIEEGARARGVEPTFPTVPEIFTKPPTAVVGDGDEVELHEGLTKQLDYEVELAIVVGKTCRDVPLDGVDDVVFGYTIANDVTARDLQRAHGQWFKGKGLDTSLPVGPWIVTARRLRRSLDAPPEALRQRRSAPGRDDRRHAVRLPADRLRPQRRADAGAGRHHLHRHAVGRRPRLLAAEAAEGRRCHGLRDHRHRHAHQPRRRPARRLTATATEGKLP